MSSGGDGGAKQPSPHPPGTGGIDPTKTFGPLQGGPGIIQLPQGNGFSDAIKRSMMNGYEPNGGDPQLGRGGDYGDYGSGGYGGGDYGDYGGGEGGFDY